jgi:ketosteroid isomerase-like protein
MLPAVQMNHGGKLTMNLFKISLTALLSICAPVLMAVAETSPDAQQLLAADRAWAEAAAARDVEKLVTFWSDDAVDYFPEKPAAVGRDAIIALVRSNRSDPGYSLHWQADAAVVSDSGELGYTSGRFTATFGTEDGGTVTRTGHYLCIWRKQDDGQWKCILETSVFEPGAA